MTQTAATPASRPSLRNIALIAHVDHGKTTLVDAMLRQTGAIRRAAADGDRLLDSMDLEKERGITILAKNTAVSTVDADGDPVTINIVDTPGHADFGGEVERALSMVDGALLLVDSSEGPLPQTRFVLRKALERNLPIILVVNKIDRPDARIGAVIDEVYELFLDLDAMDHHIEFPIVYTNARAGTAVLDLAEPASDLQALFDTILTTIPPPDADAELPLQALVANLDASDFVGRLAICRIVNGRMRRNQPVAWCREDGTIAPARIGVIYATENHERVERDEAHAGEIVAVSGLAEITIGDTIADPNAPAALPRIAVDEPSLSMTIGVNTSPLAGRDGSKLTARLVQARLEAELIGNVSLRLGPTARPDQWEVFARGELQLAVLVETMRREGFELTVGKPQVVTREIDGVVSEPTERLTIDVPEDHLGTVTTLMAARSGQLEQIVNHGTGWVRLDFVVPARGLIGFRTEFLTETRGTGVMHHIHEGFVPWVGEMRNRERGSLIADRTGAATAYAIVGLQERATLFVQPGDDVYDGMVVGENSRAEDMVVNITREKKQTNMRAAASDQTVTLTPPRQLSLDAALEQIATDECVEITPQRIRLRKAELDATVRARAAKSQKHARS